MKNFIHYVNLSSKSLLKISFVKDFLMGLFKIIFFFFSMSFSLLISAFYNFGVGFARRESVRKKHFQYQNYYFIGLFILISSILYGFYSYAIFLNGGAPRYSKYVAIGIATITFFDIALAVMGIVRARKMSDLQREGLKLTNLATSIISLSLTQTAILSFTREEDMSFFNGIGGIFFAVLAGIIGLYMIFITFKKQKKDIS